MKKITPLAIAATLAATISLPAFAAVDATGNGAPSGPHYNLNIIGVDKAKSADMVGTSGHTIFVPLKSTKLDDGTVDSKIWLYPGEEFKVCDRNGFDAAYKCDGSALTSKNGAVFELPCNTNIPNDQDGFIGCGDTPTANYQVWARAVGKPGEDATATITTCATVQDELQCSTENAVLTRTKGGKPVFTDVTNELTSMVVEYCIQYAEDGTTCTDWETTRIALFAGDTQDWFWNYDNKGLRLAQLRFYEIPVSP